MTIVQAAPLDIGTARYVRVVIWSDVNQPETSSSALFGNEGQEPRYHNLCRVGYTLGTPRSLGKVVLYQVLQEKRACTGPSNA